MQLYQVYFILNGFKILLLIDFFMIYNKVHEIQRINIRKYDDKH